MLGGKGREECGDKGTLTGYYDGVPIAAKLHGFDSAVVAAPAFRRDALLYIPEEDLAIASYAGEARVVGCDGDVEDGVAMCFVFLDWSRRLDYGRAIGIVWNGARKVYCSV